MPFHLEEVLEEDCTAFALLDEAASVDWPLARAMEQGKGSHQDMFEEWFRAVFGKDSSMRWVKVVDDETGEMAAGALWRVISAVSEANTYAGRDTNMEDTKRGDEKVDDIPPVFVEMGRRWRVFQDEFIGDNPFVNLQVLVTHPKYQRKGAASMLVKYGCDLADENGLPCALTASEAGYPLYLRHGFEVKKTTHMDLKPYGVDAVAPRIGMVRAAKQG